MLVEYGKYNTIFVYNVPYVIHILQHHKFKIKIPFLV